MRTKSVVQLEIGTLYMVNSTLIPFIPRNQNWLKWNMYRTTYSRRSLRWGVETIDDWQIGVLAKTGINWLAPLYPASSFRSDWIWRLSRSSTARISFLNGFKDVQSLRRAIEKENRDKKHLKQIQHHSNIIWSVTHLGTFDDTSVLLSSSFMSGSPAEGPACFCDKHHRKSLSMKNPVPSSVHLIIPMLNFLLYCTILMRILQPQSVCWLQGTIKSKRVTSDFFCPFLHDSHCYLQHLKAW